LSSFFSFPFPLHPTSNRRILLSISSNSIPPQKPNPPLSLFYESCDNVSFSFNVML
jgi:hypothetical protein